MIPRKTRNGVILLAALTAFSFWLGRSGSDPRQEPISGLDTRLDYALHEFEARYFDAGGKQAVRLRAPTLSNDANSGIGVIENPSFEVVQDGNRWNIVAESATVTADREHIVLAGGVNMRRRDPVTAGWLEVNTSEITLDVLPRIARSDQPVVIQEGGNVLEAVGFRIDMNDNSFHLDDQVKGRYVLN